MGANIKRAITGGIGSGKSYICRLLEEKGFSVFYCDDEAKRIIRTNLDVRKALKTLVGDDVYSPTGELNKPKLAAYICLGPAYSKKVDAIVHPLVRKCYLDWHARQKARGFNQTEEIFASWLRAHDIALLPLLVRTRETAPLYEHTRAERQRELRGAFAVTEGMDVSGQDILLLDDIMTTGATLTECARTLKRAGARNVYAVALTSEHL